MKYKIITNLNGAKKYTTNGNTSRTQNNLFSEEVRDKINKTQNFENGGFDVPLNRNK